MSLAESFFNVCATFDKMVPQSGLYIVIERAALQTDRTCLSSFWNHFEFRLFTALLATRPADCGFEVWLSMN